MPATNKSKTKREKAIVPASIEFFDLKLVEASYRENPDHVFKGRSLPVEFRVGVKREFSNQKKACVVSERMEIFPGELEKSPFQIIVEMRGHFQVSDKKEIKALETFCECNAPAIILPYIRAYIEQLGAHTPFDPIRVPLLNLAGLASNK